MKLSTFIMFTGGFMILLALVSARSVPAVDTFIALAVGFAAFMGGFIARARAMSQPDPLRGYKHTGSAINYNLVDDTDPNKHRNNV